MPSSWLLSRKNQPFPWDIITEFQMECAEPAQPRMDWGVPGERPALIWLFADKRDPRLHWTFAEIDGRPPEWEAGGAVKPREERLREGMDMLRRAAIVRACGRVLQGHLDVKHVHIFTDRSDSGGLFFSWLLTDGGLYDVPVFQDLITDKSHMTMTSRFGSVRVTDIGMGFDPLFLKESIREGAAVYVESTQAHLDRNGLGAALRDLRGLRSLVFLLTAHEESYPLLLTETFRGKQVTYVMTSLSSLLATSQDLDPECFLPKDEKKN